MRTLKPIKTLRYFYDFELPYGRRREFVNKYLERFGVSKVAFHATIKKDIQDVPFNKVMFFAEYFTQGSVDRLLEKMNDFNKKERPKKMTSKEFLS